jgi:hypothetical protein
MARLVEQIMYDGYKIVLPRDDGRYFKIYALRRNGWRSFWIGKKWEYLDGACASLKEAENFILAITTIPKSYHYDSMGRRLELL